MNNFHIFSVRFYKIIIIKKKETEMENEFQHEEDLVPEELSFGDKITGAITNPEMVFSSISKFELKTSDWLVPLIIVLAGAVLFTILKFMDPEVKTTLWEKQKVQTIEQLKKEGKSADEIKQVNEIIQKQQEMMSGPLGYVFMGIPIFIGGFIMFFIAAGIYLLLAKLILKSPMDYKGMMIAYSLPALLPVAGMVVSTIITLLFSTMYNDTSLASFLGIDKGPEKHFLSILDPVKIFSCYLTGVGMAKLSNSEDKNKYVILSIGILVGFYVFLGTLSLAFPGLQNFGM